MEMGQETQPGKGRGSKDTSEQPSVSLAGPETSQRKKMPFLPPSSPWALLPPDSPG